MLLDVIDVKAKNDYTLSLLFENNDKRLFDMKPFLHQKPFNRLLNDDTFMKASVALGTVVWPGNIDIAPETLWERSTPL